MARHATKGKKNVTIELDEWLLEALNQEAKDMGISRSQWIKQAINNYRKVNNEE